MSTPGSCLIHYEVSMKSYEVIPIQTISEYDSLIAQIRQLKQDIADLTAEKDDLEGHICREILADYNEKVGNAEFEATLKLTEIEKLKRVIAYIQAALNRQEAASYEEARRQTEKDFKKYEEDLKKKAEDIKKNAEYARERAKQDEKNRQEAQRRREAAQKMSAVSPKTTGEAENTEEETGLTDTGKPGERSDNAESEQHTEEAKEPKEEPKQETPEEEMKRLYRKIVKKLHPDMNPDITELEKALLQDAMDAYEKGDLERLREIAETIDDTDIAEKFKDTAEDIAMLKELWDRLLLQKKDLEYQIRQIKDSFPYNMKDMLADEAWVAERRELIRVFAEECDAEIARLNARIEELRAKLKT